MRQLFVVAMICIAISLESCKANNVVDPKAEESTLKKPTTNSLTVFSVKMLKQAKLKIKSSDPEYVSVYQRLVKDADKALGEGPFSVMDKIRVAPSGDKHDYLSLAPYFWPDETKADGLPWIRRDGEVDPLSRDENVDEPNKVKCFKNIKLLSMAFYFSEKKEYAVKTLELLTTWFVKPETRMNPNLNYAQGIPGLNDGRPFGVIEFTGIQDVITAIEILKLSNSIGATDEQSLREWMKGYAHWLATSELGVQEKNTLNNHGTWYDVQLTTIYLFLGDREAARGVLNGAKKRIDLQIAEDGSQPHELARTKSLSYSTMNLSAFTQLAILGTSVDVDLWNYKNPSGSGIQKAYTFLYPFALGEKEWTQQQIGNMDDAMDHLHELFTKAGSAFGVHAYCTQSNNISLVYFCEK